MIQIQVTMTLEELTKNLKNAMYCARVETMRDYEIGRDLIREKDVDDYLQVRGIPKKEFRAYLSTGLVKARQLGKAVNSPLVYSRAEIAKAIMTANMRRTTAGRMVYVDPVLDKDETETV